MNSLIKRGGAFFSQKMNKWTIIGFVVVFILLAMLIIKVMGDASSNKMSKNMANMRGMNPVMVSGREGFATSASNIEILFFNVDWCPHCVRAKPEWGKFVDKHSGDSNITFVGGKEGTNCTDNDDSSVRDLIQKYNIQHFPTVYFVKDGTPTEYQGKVTAENLESFLNSM